MMIPIFVRHKKVLRRIDPEKLVHLSTKGNYTKFKLSDNTSFTVRTTLYAALQKLPEDIFIQVNPSTVISVLHMDTVAKDHITIGRESFPIKKSFYELVMMRLNIFG